MDILKKLEDKDSKVGLNRQDVNDKRYHKQYVREYRIWKNKQGILPFNSNVDTSSTTTKNKDSVKKITKKPENIVKSSEAPIITSNKSAKQLHQLYQTNKRKLLDEMNRRTNPEGPPRRLSTSGKKRLLLLKEKVGIEDDQELKTLAKHPKEKLDILITLSAEYKQKTGKNINVKNNVDEKKEGVSKMRKLRSTYRSAVKYLKKFEEHDLDTLTDREKALLRICLRRKQRIDEEQGTPLTTTRFDYLLTEETKQDDKTVTNTDSTKEEKNDKNVANADDAVKNEDENNEDENNEDENNECANNEEENNTDLTEEQEDDQVENDAEIGDEVDEEAEEEAVEEIAEEQNENALDNETEKE